MRPADDLKVGSAADYPVDDGQNYDNIQDHPPIPEQGDGARHLNARLGVQQNHPLPENFQVLQQGSVQSASLICMS